MMNRPDESGISMIAGATSLVSAFAWVQVDSGAPSWFLLFLGCVGAWLIAYPLLSRHFITRGMVAQGAYPDEVRKQWAIDLGFTKI